MNRRAASPLTTLALTALVIGCTSPPPPPNGPDGAGRAVEGPHMRFAVIGDFGSGNSSERAVATLVKGWHPDFVLTVGDNNYPEGQASTIDQRIGSYYAEFIGGYEGTYGPGSPTTRFYPALGNHDWGKKGDSSAHLDYFHLPGNERYYDVDLGLVHLFVVDSDNREPDGVEADSRQATWLRDALAASKAPWDVVAFHHAPYTSGKHGSSTWMRWPFEEWGADLVLAGHVHVYERVQVGGIPYVVCGLGGAAIYPFEGPPLPETLFRWAEGHGALLVTATGREMTVEFQDTDGDRIDAVVVNRAAP